MPSKSHNKGRVRRAETSIKDEEDEKQLLDSVPTQSTIAQFIKSGQAAFGSVDPQLLKQHNEVPGEVQKWMLDRIREKLAAASNLYHDDILVLRPLLKLEYSTNSTGLQLLVPELTRLMRSNLTFAVVFTNHVLDAPTNEVPRTMKDDLLRAVAQDLGAVPIDMREYETIERQLAAVRKKQSEGSSGSQPLAKLSAAALGLFTKHFYSLGLYNQIETMLAHLGSQMNRAHSIDLHTIYIPFLQELISLMLIYGIPLTNVTYSSFFESVLQLYLERFVGQEPAQEIDTEHAIWAKRAFAARATLESFDHSYFQHILGSRYDNNVLPALMKLPSSTSASQAQNQFDSLTTVSTAGTKVLKTSVTTDDDNFDPEHSASTSSMPT